MLREIVLDTETTGFEPREGHRIVEIGCLELINHVATGQTFHVYLNPERDMPEEAAAIHGLRNPFLDTQKKFAEEATAFIEFIGDAPLVIHNAKFDMKFLNAELIADGREPLAMDRAIDTLMIARKRFPGAQASLDSLCRRFGIDNSNRTLHGALLDSELLAEVYLNLIGGRQPTLLGEGEAKDQATSGDSAALEVPVVASDTDAKWPKREFSLNDDERQAHAEFRKELTDPIWDRFD